MRRYSMTLSDNDRNFYNYNAIDSSTMVHDAREFWDELNAVEGHLHIYDQTMRLIPPLIFMMMRGIRVDVDAVKTLARELGEDIIAKRAELDEVAGRKLPETFANSSKQCIQYFYVEKGIDPYTKQGAKGKSVITTDDKAMARLARGTASRAPIKEARLVQDIRGLVKMKGTYAEIEFDDDRRFRCDCKPRGTRMGRISTGITIRNTGMNMQNLPNRFKRYLQADEGRVFLELDKRQAEWVVVAYLAQDANMIKVIEEGLDPHVHTAYLMFGVDKELIVLENHLVGHETDPYEIARLRTQLPELSKYSFIPRSMSMRQAGKFANHGLNYDEGYKEFALRYEMAEGEARIIVEKYHTVYPGVRNRYHAKVRESIMNNRTLENCFGRVYKFLGKSDIKMFKAAYAFLPQSTVADLVNRAIIDTYEDDSYIFQWLEMLGQVHDSILEQYPLTAGTAEMARMLQIQKEYLNPEMEYDGMTFRIATDLKMGYNWADMVEVPLVDNFHEQVIHLETALNGLSRT